MIINFKEMELMVIPNFNGGEKEFRANMYIDDNNKIVNGRLIPGASIGWHCHDTSSETILILSGSGKVIVEGGEEPVSAGTVHYCPKGAFHSLVNTGEEDLCFFAVVPQHK